MTFSITGFDPRTGMLGVAVATRYWAVGARVPYVRAGLAALAVQAYAQPYLGYDTLRLMAEHHLDGPTALGRVLDDMGIAGGDVVLHRDATCEQIIATVRGPLDDPTRSRIAVRLLDAATASGRHGRRRDVAVRTR